MDNNRVKTITLFCSPEKNKTNKQKTLKLKKEKKKKTCYNFRDVNLLEGVW